MSDANARAKSVDWFAIGDRVPCLMQTEGRDGFSESSPSGLNINVGDRAAGSRPSIRPDLGSGRSDKIR